MAEPEAGHAAPQLNVATQDVRAVEHAAYTVYPPSVLQIVWSYHHVCFL
jgi:hypothetical protein